jgi:hypothetical protein
MFMNVASQAHEFISQVLCFMQHRFLFHTTE